MNLTDSVYQQQIFESARQQENITIARADLMEAVRYGYEDQRLGRCMAPEVEKQMSLPDQIANATDWTWARLYWARAQRINEQQPT